jgi:UDP-N-acetylglucosamine acyltransferase
VAIHPSAVIDPSAKIHENAEICAYTIIGANVEIGI